MRYWWNNTDKEDRCYRRKTSLSATLYTASLRAGFLVPALVLLLLLLLYYYYFYYFMPIEILETLVCLILTLNVETVLPVDALRRQIPSTVLWMYSMDDQSRLI